MPLELPDYKNILGGQKFPHAFLPCWLKVHSAKCMVIDANMKKKHGGRPNCYVFGIVGKLFQNVREWCLFHANILNISRVIQVSISPSPCPTTKLNFWIGGVHIFLMNHILLFKFKGCFTKFQAIHCKNNLFALNGQVILLNFSQNWGTKRKKHGIWQ